MAAPTETNTTRSSVWKKYLFEFVLVFSAVFLGFLADNFRDQYSERQKAGELARSFYEELINDSIAIAAKVQGRIKKEHAVEYMVKFLKDSSLTSASKSLSLNFLWATTIRTPVIFTPRTVVLEQLRSSGAVQYFKSKELQKLVGDLLVSIEYIQERQALEALVYHEYMEPIMIRHMDYDFQNQLFTDGIFNKLDAYEQSSAYIPFHLSQIEKINRTELINLFWYYHTNNLKSTRLIPFDSYIRINAELLKLLRNEFHLANPH